MYVAGCDVDQAAAGSGCVAGGTVDGASHRAAGGATGPGISGGSGGGVSPVCGT